MAIVTEAKPRPGFVKRYWKDALIVVAVLVGVRLWQAPDVDGDALPELGAATIDGQAVPLASADGKPTLLYFWAAWCGVCKSVSPNIAELSTDARVVTVASSSGSADDVRAYMREQSLDFPVVNDPSGAIAQSFGVRGFPTAFVLDEHGHAVVTEVGYTTTLGLKARLYWAGL